MACWVRLQAVYNTQVQKLESKDSAARSGSGLDMDAQGAHAQKQMQETRVRPRLPHNKCCVVM